MVGDAEVAEEAVEAFRTRRRDKELPKHLQDEPMTPGKSRKIAAPKEWMLAEEAEVASFSMVSSAPSEVGKLRSAQP
jgi:hypothetical protein